MIHGSWNSNLWSCQPCEMFFSLFSLSHHCFLQLKLSITKQNFSLFAHNTQTTQHCEQLILKLLIYVLYLLLRIFTKKGHLNPKQYLLCSIIKTFCAVRGPTVLSTIFVRLLNNTTHVETCLSGKKQKAKPDHLLHKTLH